jgi:hypothetical protein
MEFALVCHPQTPTLTVDAITVQLTRGHKGAVKLCYSVHGDIRQIDLPSPLDAARTDGLWQHSCFEMFVRPDGRQGYCEFNFSPSSQWAAYGFDGYRNGMAEMEGMVPPEISMLSTPKRLDMHVSLSVGLLAVWPEWHVGLSTIIEEKDGTKSYWALSHPAGVADFHDQDCFIAKLSASRSS